MDDQFFSAFAVGLLAFVRIVFIFQQAPILGSKHIKGQAKVGLAACLAVVAFPNLPMPENMPEDPRGFILALLAQVVVGLAIGYVSFLVMAAAQFGGEMMDIQMGLSVAASMDPSSGGTSKLLNRLNFYVAMMLYLMVDGHHMLLRALFRSFQVIPVTEFRVSGRLVSEFITHTEEIFLIGLQVAAPPPGGPVYNPGGDGVTGAGRPADERLHAELSTQYRHRLDAILHWTTGDPGLTARAV